MSEAKKRKLEAGSWKSWRECLHPTNPSRACGQQVSRLFDETTNDTVCVWLSGHAVKLARAYRSRSYGMECLLFANMALEMLDSKPKLTTDEQRDLAGALFILG